MGDNNDNNNDNKGDLTRIEDLQEFEHAEEDVTFGEDHVEEEIEGVPPLPSEEKSPEEGGADEMEEAEEALAELDISGEDEEDVMSALEKTLETSAALSEEEERAEEELSLEPEAKEAPAAEPEQDALAEMKESLSELTYGQLTLGQGPSFSISIKGISTEETKEKIRELLAEMGFEITEYEQGIALGQILIGHINEYSAIYLAHKLRDIPVEISLGPSEFIHQAKTYDDDSVRGISQLSPEQENREQAQDFPHGSSDEFFISFSSNVPQKVKHQLGMVQAVRKVSSEDLVDIPELSELSNPESDGYKNYLKHYESLIDELKQKAIKKCAHGLIQLNFQIVPLSDQSETELAYQIVATAVLVQF